MNGAFRKILSRLGRSLALMAGIPKSLVFNLRYFGVANGLKFPAFIGHSVRLAGLRGEIALEAPLRTGMLQIGITGVAPFAYDKVRTVWHNQGTVVLRGKATIGRGSKISVLPGAVLTLGRDFVINARSDLFCGREITFGSDCLLSWDVLIMDQDFHPIYDASGKASNPPAAIHFGDRVWIGCRTLVLKGVSIGGDTVIAAASTVARSISGDHQIIAGAPARVVKPGISWGDAQKNETLDLHSDAGLQRSPIPAGIDGLGNGSGL